MYEIRHTILNLKLFMFIKTIIGLYFKNKYYVADAVECEL